MATEKPSRAFFAILALLGLAAALGIAVGAYNIVRGPVFQTLRAARLAPLPRSAVEVESSSKVEPQGYSVHVKFDAPVADIDAWLAHSPSALKITPERPSAGTRRYTLPPSEQAKAASVTVDEAKGQVTIDLVRS